MEKVAFHTANSVVDVEHLPVDITKNVYFTLSAEKLNDMCERAKAMHITSFHIMYSKGDMWHLLNGNVHTGNLVMGTHGDEGDIDNYWCDSAKIHVQLADMERIVNSAKKYQDYEELRILCKVDEFNIIAGLSLELHFDKLVTYGTFGAITHKECLVRTAERDYTVTYSAN